MASISDRLAAIPTTATYSPERTSWSRAIAPNSSVM
jgi:hypothetical protein